MGFITSYWHFIVMVIGFGIAMFGSKKQKAGADWGQILAIVGAGIAIIAAIIYFIQFFSGSGTKKGMAREKRYMYLQAKFLGDAVKKSNPQKVCVICDPNLFVDAYGEKLPKEVQSDYLDGIRDALKGAEIIPIYPEFKRQKPKGGADAAMMVMPYTMLSYGDYKKMCEKIKKQKPDAVINIYQFPMEATLPEALKLLKGYKVGFLNSSSNDQLIYAFNDGGKQCAEVVAVVMTKVDAVYDETIPSSDKKAFDRRFVLALPSDFQQKIKEANGGK